MKPYIIGYWIAFKVLASTLRNDSTNELGVNYRGFLSAAILESSWHFLKAIIYTVFSPIIAFRAWSTPAFKEYLAIPAIYERKPQ